MAETLGTAQSEWTALGTTTNATLSAKDTYTLFDTIPGSVNPYAIAVPESNTLALLFFGDPNAGDPKTIEVQFWAVNGITIGMDDKYIGIWLGTVELDIGTTASTTLAANTFFFSDIRITEDRSMNPPGMRVISADPDTTKGAAVLAFDSLGAEYVVVQIARKGGIDLAAPRGGLSNKGGTPWRRSTLEQSSRTGHSRMAPLLPPRSPTPAHTPTTPPSLRRTPAQACL